MIIRKGLRRSELRNMIERRNLKFIDFLRPEDIEELKHKYLDRHSTSSRVLNRAECIDYILANWNLVSKDEKILQDLMALPGMPTSLK